MEEKKLLPKWLLKRYLILWDILSKNKATEKFGFDDAASILKGVWDDDRRTVALVLSELRKAGWLEVTLDPSDNRKRIYKLSNYEKVLGDYVNNISKERGFI